jgi:hypothetical protein
VEEQFGGPLGAELARLVADLDREIADVAPGEAAD